MEAESKVIQKVTVPESIDMISFLGPHDIYLRTLEKGLAPAQLHVLEREITISGPPLPVELAKNLLNEFISVLQRGQYLNVEAVESAIRLAQRGLANPADLLRTDIISACGKTIRPKTFGQKEYVDAIDTSTITFGIGPAGTGKTYLAVAKAVEALQSQQVRRIVLSRPAVEAGESLGFLPGTLSDKIDPYLRPLYDALYDMVEPDSIPKLLAAGTIEVVPLAYMRGRTLNDAFVILDEAQNTTPAQMKMFLTRLGFQTKMVITGDLTQIDLPTRTTSGLRLMRSILADISGIKFIELKSEDVVRNSLVADIVDAYTRWSENYD